VALEPAILDLSGALPVTNVRLTAQISDVVSAEVQTTVANAEAFIGTAGPDGSGFALFPSDGLFDEVSEAAYFDIPIANFLNLSQGDHPIYVHGLDAAGNWGPVGSATLTVNKGEGDIEGPIVTALDVAPNPTQGATSVTLTAAAADPGSLSNIAAAEWSVDGGTAFPMQATDGAFDSPTELLNALISVSGWSNGQHLFSVRAQDSLGNWGPVAQVRLRVTGNNAVMILNDNFNAGNLALWSGVVGQVAVVPDAALPAAANMSQPDSVDMGLQTTVDGGAPAYVSFLMPPGEINFNASFSFDPNSVVLGAGEHDIFLGLDGDTPIFGIQCEVSGDGTGYEVRGWVLVGGVATYTAWYDIEDSAHGLGIVWRAAPVGSFSLAIDGLVVEEMPDLDTGGYRLHEIRLGPSANLDAAMSGAEYFDNFEGLRMVLVYLPVTTRSQ
jgi:hypothetical protein